MGIPDFRSLCAELLAALEAFVVSCPYNDRPHGNLMYRARAALAAEPDPAHEGEVTKQCVDGLCCEHGFHYEDDESLNVLVGIIRDAIARYGNASAPVSMTERPPEPEHCNHDGECWTTTYNPAHVYNPVWKLTGLPKKELGHDFSNAYFWRGVRYWLPYWALPLAAATQPQKT